MLLIRHSKHTNGSKCVRKAQNLKIGNEIKENRQEVFESEYYMAEKRQKEGRGGDTSEWPFAPAALPRLPQNDHFLSPDAPKYPFIL
ncbi:hypothetical protein EGR_11111 [Echinococcus granulosus]|uniref:Uncharacterized protein n=1 Tax=Echinococcus granulosus TaxID=6210 RepID=W6U6S1_ECHGR|nr:hypothetical protein EGR_11111 [Echinococcus granulosus]EUB54032.1 hypothetical protein EGR_11111 [Echinococcus granulosus]